MRQHGAQMKPRSLLVGLAVTGLLLTSSRALDEALVEMGVHYMDDEKTYAIVKRETDFDFQKAIPHLAKLKNLKIFQMSYCPGLTNLDGIGKLPIEVFLVNDCENLSDLQGLRNHPTLKSVNLSGSLKLTNVDGIDGLRKLEFLEFAFNPNLAQANGLRNLPALKELLWYDCESMVKGNGLASLSRMGALEKLEIRRTGLTSLLGIGRPPKLKELSVTDCKKLTSLNGIQAFAGVRKLLIGACPVEKVSEIGSLKRLEILELNVTQVKSLAGLQGLSNLRVVTVIQNPNLENISALGKLGSLEQLACERNQSMKDLNPLRQCKKLRYLSASADHLTVPLIAALKSLQVVLGAPSGSQLKALKRKAPKVRFLQDESASQFRYGKWEENTRLK